MSGTWALTINSPQGDQPSTLTITQNGESISGTMASQMGTVPVQGGSIAGRTMSWSISLPINGNNMDISIQPSAIVDPTASILNPQPARPSQTTGFTNNNGSNIPATTFISAKLTQ